MGMKYLALTMLIAGIILPVIIAVVVSRITLSPIKKIKDALEGVEKGDLTRRIDISWTDG
jgi:methyl-accepting chemotaxis protein